MTYLDRAFIHAVPRSIGHKQFGAWAGILFFGFWIVIISLMLLVKGIFPIPVMPFVVILAICTACAFVFGTIIALSLKWGRQKIPLQ